MRILGGRSESPRGKTPCGRQGSPSVRYRSRMVLAGDRIRDAAGVTLAGGTFQTAGHSETVGALTLSLSSIIDFGDGLDPNALTFANSSALEANWTGTLSIYNWTGSIDRLFFGSDANGLTVNQLAQISFYSGPGSGFLGGGAILGTGEIVPVPEPSAVFGAVGLLGLVGWRERRKAARVRQAERCRQR